MRSLCHWIGVDAWCLMCSTCCNHFSSFCCWYLFDWPKIAGHSLCTEISSSTKREWENKQQERWGKRQQGQKKRKKHPIILQNILSILCKCYCVCAWRTARWKVNPLHVRLPVIPAGLSCKISDHLLHFGGPTLAVPSASSSPSVFSVCPSDGRLVWEISLSHPTFPTFHTFPTSTDADLLFGLSGQGLSAAELSDGADSSELSHPWKHVCIRLCIYICVYIYIYNHIHMKHSETTNWSRVLIPGSLDVVCWWTSAWPARHLPSAKAHLEGDWGCMWSVTTSAFAAAASRGSSGTARWSWCL